jgi:hypothetical protein
MRLLCLTALLLALAGCAEWNRDYDTMTRPDSTSMSSYEVQTEQRQIPELESKRKVNDVDCSKPFDPTLGNVRCR